MAVWYPVDSWKSSDECRVDMLEAAFLGTHLLTPLNVLAVVALFFPASRCSIRILHTTRGTIVTRWKSS
jgi:hypothetical protein